MFGRGQGWLLAFALAGGLLMPTRLLAGPLLGSRSNHKADCPKSSYSPLHYWNPTLYRLRACVKTPTISNYASDRYPELPNPYQITPFPCPAAPPAALYGHHKAGY